MLMERWKLSISVEKRGKLPKQFECILLNLRNAAN